MDTVCYKSEYPGYIDSIRRFTQNNEGSIASRIHMDAGKEDRVLIEVCGSCIIPRPGHQGLELE